MKRGVHKLRYLFATNFSWWFGNHGTTETSRLQPGFPAEKKPG